MLRNVSNLISAAQRLLDDGCLSEALDLIQAARINFEEDAAASAALLRVTLIGLSGLGRWRDLISLASPLLPHLPKASASLCDAHGYLGLAHMRTGSHRLAESHLRAAIHVASWDLRDSDQSIFHQRQLAIMFKNLGWWQLARHEVEIAIEQADATGSHKQSGALRKNLAIILLKCGDLGPVLKLLDEAEAYLVSSDKPHWLLRARLVRGRYHVLVHHPTKALEILNPILEITRAQQYSREEAICLEYIGDCFLIQKEFKKALEHYLAAQAIADATAPKGDLIPELGHRIGEAFVILGDPNAAILACERGLRVARDTGDRYEECATHRVLAMANLAAGNPRKALRLAAEGVELARSYEIPYELARVLQWSGEARLQTNQPDERALGRRRLWEARGVYERLGLAHQAKAIERLLGLETQPEPDAEEPGVNALQGIADLDRGALRFGIITTSPDVSEAVATIQSVAPSRIPVLITGQTGVGKELLAKALHLMSDRRKNPFVSVNCGAMSPNLVDSELFGHERGAFTGAVASREGLFASAHQGTLFLDEVAELSQIAQATLLRVLETGELRPVGRDDIRLIDVRVVAATNAILEDLVDRGVFRQDLYYRLNGVSVTVPPLQDREEDIRALFRYFWAQSVAGLKKTLTLADDVESMICAYAWPGNVRELRNEIARVVTMAESGSIVSRQAFLPKHRARSSEALRRDRDRLAQDSAERDQILRALRAHQGNKTEAARSLGGMKRTTLIYKIERLGIRPEEYLVSE